MYSMALVPRFLKWKMLSLSGPKALLFLHLLISLLTRSVVNVCAISKDFLFVSLVTNRVSLEEVCLPSFGVLNCWLNLVASCLDDENEIPLKVIALFSASRFALLSIPLIVLHSLVISGPRSQQNLSTFGFCVRRCDSGYHNSVLAVQARWDLFYGGHLLLSSHPISLLVQVPRGVCVVVVVVVCHDQVRLQVSQGFRCRDS